MSHESTIEDVLAGRARWCVVVGDSAEVLRSLPAACVDAVVTDPPAGIAFMGAEWDRDKGGRAQWVAWLAGILGLARVATKPGGRALVWSLPRTSHWTGCAVEDSGWVPETTVAHLFGTGWPKGQSQLKPAQETWWLARTGPSTALNVDACRVAHKTINGGNLADNPHLRGSKKRAAPVVTAFGREGDETDLTSQSGRWPTNLVLSHSPDCVCVGEKRVRGSHSTTGTWNHGVGYQGVGYQGGAEGVATASYVDADGRESVEAWECVEGCPVKLIDEQSGITTSPTKTVRGAGGQHGAYSAIGAQGEIACHGDSGASRFYPTFTPDPADFLYAAKPSTAERNAGCEHLTQRSADAYAAHRGRRMEGDPVRMDGTEAPRAGNHHPTAKGIQLMSWLVRLITQPGDVVLDPFGGSGGTGLGALAEGRRVILIERDETFAAIARARLAYHEEHGFTARKSKSAPKPKAPPPTATAKTAAPIVTAQQSLFGGAL